MNTIEKLDKLAEIYAHQTIVNMNYEDQRKAILATVQDKLNDLDTEFEPMKSDLVERAGVLEAEIKAEVLTGGATIKGANVMAVWSKPRITWDTKQLDGLMIVIPQLAQARKEGEPSVSIRKIG